MAEPRDVKPRERDILEHSLKGGTNRVYRNHFAADLGTVDGYTCMRLVSKGLMVQGRRLCDNVELHEFHVTKAGAEAVGLHLPHE